MQYCELKLKRDNFHGEDFSSKNTKKNILSNAKLA